jgi:hypothetical protein
MKKRFLPFFIFILFFIGISYFIFEIYFSNDSRFKITSQSQVAAGVQGLSSGIVGWWKFNDGSGTFTKNAGLTPEGNDPLYGETGLPVWTTGQMFGALLFDDDDAPIGKGSTPSFLV